MITAYLQQEVILYLPVGRTAHGDITYDNGQTVKARIIGKNTLTRGVKGDLIQSDYEVLVKARVQRNDRLNFNGRNWTVLSSTECLNINGVVEYWGVRV